MLYVNPNLDHQNKNKITHTFDYTIYEIKLIEKKTLL